MVVFLVCAATVYPLVALAVLLRRPNAGSAIADFIERPGGEVMVGFGLMAVGALLWLLTVPKGEDAVIAGGTLISRALCSGAGSRGEGK